MEWISVKDRLPEEGIKVLSYLENYDEYKIDYIILFPEPIWACVLERDQNTVTHWMPLHKSPQQVSQCHITGCRNLKTTCCDCGRVVCTKNLDEKKNNE